MWDAICLLIKSYLSVTPREYKAFQAILGKSRPIKITSAISVGQFSDNYPSKYVKLPLSKLGLQSSRKHPSQARTVFFDESNEGGLETISYARGADDGPVISALFQNVAGLGRGSYQGSDRSSSQESSVFHGVIRFPDDSSQSFSNKGNLVPPSTLTYGFRPLYSNNHDSARQNSNFAIGGHVDSNIFTSHQSQEQFRPLSPLVSTIDIIEENNVDFSSFGSNSFSGVKPQDSSENLYRHHVNRALIPTKDAGPGTNAVGKLLAAQGSGLDNSQVVVRSVDETPNVSGNSLQLNTEVKFSLEKGKKGSADESVFVDSSISEKPVLDIATTSDLSSLGFFPNAGVGTEDIVRETPSNISPTIFSSNSVKIPNLPNVQLPLQTQEPTSFKTNFVPAPSSVSRKPLRNSRREQLLNLLHKTAASGTRETSSGTVVIRQEPFKVVTGAPFQHNARVTFNSPHSIRAQLSTQKRTQNPINIQSKPIIPPTVQKFSSAPISVEIKPQTFSNVQSNTQQFSQEFSNFRNVPHTSSNNQQVLPVSHNLRKVPQFSTNTKKVTQFSVNSKKVPQAVANSHKALPVPVKITRPAAPKVRPSAPSTTSFVSASGSPFSGLPASALQALGALGGGAGAGPPKVRPSAPSTTSIVSASGSPFSGLPASALQAFGALGGGAGAGGSPHIIVKSMLPIVVKTVVP